MITVTSHHDHVIQPFIHSFIHGKAIHSSKITHLLRQSQKETLTHHLTHITEKFIHSFINSNSNNIIIINKRRDAINTVSNTQYHCHHESEHDMKFRVTFIHAEKIKGYVRHSFIHSFAHTIKYKRQGQSNTIILCIHMYVFGS